jgi:putative nucleotidyltransferase with HDIG domain
VSTAAGSAPPVAAAQRAAAILDPDANVAIEELRARRSKRLGGRDRWSAILLGGAFLAAAVPLAALVPTHRSPGLLTQLLLVAAYALVVKVEFEIGTGSAIPTQLVLVPMIFLLPLGSVPLWVAAGILLGSLVGFAQGRIRLGRVFLRLMNAWHAVGPVLVLATVGEQTPVLRHWPLYVAALGAQFVFDYASTAARERLALGVSPRVLLRYMSWVYLVDAALAPIGLAIAIVAFRAPSAFLLALPLVGLLAVFARERRERIDHAIELGNAYRGTAFLLGDVVEADDEYTGIHSQDVVSLTLQVADELGLAARDRRLAEFAALLHDVGKIRIPTEIINKPGPLTPEERLVINSHTVEGEQMLSRVGGMLGEVGRIVRSCHERWDGDGYPDGLAGEQIPLVARIVCCCDAFSAMTTDRPYRAARSHGEAVEELHASAGAHFDPRVVDALARVAAR